MPIKDIIDISEKSVVFNSAIITRKDRNVKLTDVREKKIAFKLYCKMNQRQIFYKIRIFCDVLASKYLLLLHDYIRVETLLDSSI